MSEQRVATIDKPAAEPVPNLKERLEESDRLLAESGCYAGVTELALRQQDPLKYETLQGEEVKRLIRGERLDKPTVAELLEAEAAKPAQNIPPAQPAKDDQPGEEPTGDVMPSPA